MILKLNDNQYIGKEYDQNKYRRANWSLNVKILQNCLKYTITRIAEEGLI